MIYRCSLLATALLVAELPAAAQEAKPITPKEAIQLFNGKDLSGLTTWLKKTRHDDPTKVFTVKDGAIHVSGEDNGYIATDRAYQDYHLIVEYKWGKKTDGGKYVRNSGILLHGTGADGAVGGVWMASIECQLAQGCVGDLIVIRSKDTPVAIAAETALGTDKRPRWKAGGEVRTFTKGQLWWSLHEAGFKELIDTRGKQDVDSPLGEWTKVECICQGKRIQIIVNGTKVNECFDASPAAGKILLQSEGFEIDFRRFELRPLMETVAGTGKAGYAGDGGQARAALLREPFHCDLDGKGNLFIAEATNHCIRKVDLKTGIISTVAGTGKKGYSGDGGPALQAAMNEPYAVVVDEKGNLYIVDRNNAVVRKVDASTGGISTVAGNGTKGYGGDGGPGNQAMLREPNDCCLDGAGGLLIADVGDWRIRRLDLKTGIISTFAGIGKGAPKSNLGEGGPANKALIVGARAVCVDGKGNTYICEREGSKIRKVDAAGIITTVAGTGKRGSGGDGGPALKAAFDGPKGIRCDKMGNVYIVDTENHSIRRFDVKAGTVTTVAGGRKGPGGDGGDPTQAGMDRPHGCIVDDMGNIYIADSNNHRVRKASPAR